MTDEQQTDAYTYCPTLMFTFRMSDDNETIKVYEAGELVGFVTTNDRDNWVLPSVAKAARKWAARRVAGWEK